MNGNIIKAYVRLLSVAVSALALCPVVLAQGIAFTYQGRLQSGSNPAGGAYDFTFSFFTTNTGGVAIAGPVTNTAVGVTDGSPQNIAGIAFERDDRRH